MRIALDLAVFGVVLLFGMAVFENATLGLLAGIIIVTAADILIWDPKRR